MTTPQLDLRIIIDDRFQITPQLILARLAVYFVFNDKRDHLSIYYGLEVHIDILVLMLRDAYCVHLRIAR
ncbi:MAG: hypothetical protein F4W91_04555 [Gemmatimonadetes bacterium]|nr:hypothetical protein [Gemmatimonadota bacterium]